MKNPLNKFDQKYVKLGLCGFFTMIASVIVLYVLYKMVPWFGMIGKVSAAILKPLLLGIVLAYIFYPLVRFYERQFQKKFPGRAWTRSVSVLIVVLLVILALLALLVALLWTASRQITEIDYDSITQYFETVENSFGSLSVELKSFLEQQNISVSALSDHVATNVSGFLQGAVSAASIAFFGVIFAVYFLIDVDNITAYWTNAARVLLNAKTISVARELAHDADQCFSGYIRGQAADAVLVGVVTSIIMQLVGMRYAVMIGLVVGFGNLIPYLGPILGYAAVVFVNIIRFNPRMLIIGLVIVAVIMFIDGNFINPRLLAGTVHVHPLLVIASLLAGGAVGGVLGMLLAVPVGAFVKIQFDKFLVHRKNSQEKKQNRV